MSKIPDPSKLEREALETADALLATAKRLGVIHCDVSMGKGASVDVSVREQEIEELSRSSQRACGIRVIKDGRVGFSAWADVPQDEKEREEMVRTALSLSSMSTASEHNIVPERTAPIGEDLQRQLAPLNKWDPKVAEMSTDWCLEQAMSLEKAIIDTDKIDMSNNVGASQGYGVFALASSNGFRGAYSGTTCSLVGGALVHDEGNKRRTGMWWTAHRFLEQLENGAGIAQKAAQRALQKLGAQSIASTKVPVIFDPMMAKGFFSAVLSAMDGDSVSKKATFLWDQKEKQVLKEGIRLFENPLKPEGFGSTPFDGEGVKTVAQDLINNKGFMTTWLHDAQSAHRLQEAPTGHARRGSSGLPGPGISNVQVLGGNGDIESIIKSTSKGLLVTSLMGHSPNMITGEYSRGASGFWIENGERAFPVEEITIAGNMLEMMLNIDALGNDLDTRGSLQAPTVRLAELSVSGK